MRQTVILIPYKESATGIAVNLQQRSMDMERIPGYISFWGGGMDEGETPEQALIRETKEELDYDLDISKVSLLHRYDFYRTINYVYLLKVPEGWDPPKVLEGDAALWVELDTAFEIPKMLFKDKVVLNDIERALLNKPIR